VIKEKMIEKTGLLIWNLQITGRKEIVQAGSSRDLNEASTTTFTGRGWENSSKSTSF
jgi:hypothetical protein